MSNLDDFKTNFEKKLDARRAENTARLDEDIRVLKDSLMREFKPFLPANSGLPDQASEPGLRWRAPDFTPTQALVDLSGSNRLHELDEAFIQIFNLGKYYPVSRLAYPTKYCETLHEFWTPCLAQYDLSPSAFQAALNQQILESERDIEKGRRVLGINLPGKGAYINGWAITYPAKVPVQQVFEQPNWAHEIYTTTIHEKLGHGFLAVYSAFGQVNTRLGLDKIEIANRFGLRSADDPISSLRYAQANLAAHVSLLLEEGWATWLEIYMGSRMNKNRQRLPYTPQQLIDAIHKLPDDLPERGEVVETLDGVLNLLFGEAESPLEGLRVAVLILENINPALDELLKLGQPLRYVVGDLLFEQAEANLGAQCLPFAALIAANVTFDPASMGLADLRERFTSDPRLNPDVRMAALSRLNLQKKNDVQELVHQASEVLSFSIPAELK